VDRVFVFRVNSVRGDAPVPPDKILVGAFYNPHIARETLAAADLIDHLAMADPPRAGDPHFPALREQFTLLLHDFIGQLSEPIAGSALERAKKLIADYRSPWAAEHLQRVHTTDGTRFVDYVFPPLYTEDVLADYSRNARSLREALGAPLAIEPIPTYLHLDFPGIMTEAEFVTRFFESSGCDFLLDISHACLSARYARRPPRDFIAEMPLERVIEIHVAGTSVDPALEDEWIGAEAPQPEILDLMIFAAERAPRLRAVTFDAFSRALTGETLVKGLRAIRERLSVRR
jgi:uncharacterized protein (UPF0276 family)